MSAFDRIIGYDHIKTELMQISDMAHHLEAYAALDATSQQNAILLQGNHEQTTRELLPHNPDNEAMPVKGSSSGGGSEWGRR